MEVADSEREEGEIVDDEFEDVSDSSITSPFHLGKSVSASERLRSVSLSSISDSELIEVDSPRKNGHYKHMALKSSAPYTKPHHRRKRKRARGCSKRAAAVVKLSDSDDDEIFDRKTLQQLKEAVRINKSEEVHQNSLRTRLKPLIEPASEKSHTEEEEDGGDNEKQEKSGDITNDKELEELRLEALKSAMLKKHLERKKRKALESKEKGETKKLEGGDINKENTVDNAIPATENAPKKNEVVIEEDVDIMRALLLASMSRKITEASKVPQKPPAVTKPPNNNIPKPLKRTIQNNYYTSSNKIINCAKTFKPTVPIVAPLIINLNNDSGSDMDIDEDEENDQVAKSVTDFLNQQRAEVEAKKAEQETAQPPLPPPLPAGFPPPPPPTAPPVLDKSVMALLPFSQQIEYLRLKQQLQAKNVTLQKKPAPNESKGGKFSKNEGGGEGKGRNVRIKTVMRSKFSLVKQNVVKDRIRVVRANKFERDNANNLQKTLSDMQTQKDGRLEVKGKYQELAPILKKVKLVSVERKRHENEYKRLLQELEKAQQNFNASHRTFKNLMDQLMRKKQAIDKRAAVKNTVQKNPVLTTPVKVNGNLSLSQLENGLILASSTPIATNHSTKLPQKPQQESEANTVEKDILMDIVDPNDLNEHLMNWNKNVVTKTSNLPKYVSPLDKRDNDILAADPLAMLCPFDLLGVCKDKECTYKHCC